MAPDYKIPTLRDALPFWASLALIPVLAFAIWFGSWTIALVPFSTWFLFALLDQAIGKTRENIDPNSPESGLFWYRLITRIWPPTQIGVLLVTLWYVPQAAHLSAVEKLGVYFGVGVITGTIGINYAHELMHQRSRMDRWLADILLASVFYSHFRSEHLLVHHRYVGTPRDPVTARYGESFFRFFSRVLPGCLLSALKAEARLQDRVGRPAWHRSNPFWRYAALQAVTLGVAALLGGWWGVALVLFQGFVSIWQLELVNYVEHYGLERRYIGDGKYEPVGPRHSWNATYQASNWLLINLQRHSDHHFNPTRPFPLLQSGDPDETPELPYGYPVMTTAAMVPPLWHRIMSPRVKAWRKHFYPDVSDWAALPRPMPR
ncbi:MAG: alkane 1-monooxygenase [Pseudomonadota bacterium]